MTNCNTPQLTRTNTPAPVTRSLSLSKTPTKTPASTRTPSPTTTPSLSISKSLSGTCTPTKTQTNSSSLTKTQSQTASKTQTPTHSKTQQISRTPTLTPTSTVTNSNTATLTRSNTPTQTGTKTQTPTSSQTRTPTVSITPSRTQTGTNTQTPINSSTQTQTPTCTRTSTQTRTNTQTPTQTTTRSRTPTQTKTSSFTPTKTRTPSTNSAICSGIIIDSGNNYTGSLTLDNSTIIISDINSQYNITDIQHNPGVCNPRTLILSGGGENNSINNISSYNNANFNIFKSGVGSWLLGSGTYNGKLFVEQGELIINNNVLSSGAGPFGSSNLRPLIGTTGVGEEIIKSSLLLNAGYFINKGFDIINSSSDNNEIIIGGINSGQSVYSGIQIRSDRELTLSASTDNETVFFSDFKNSTGTQNASIPLNIGSPTNDGIIRLASSGSLPDTITELNILNGKLILDFTSNNSLPPIKIGNNWIDETFNPTLDILNYEKFLYNLTFDSPHLGGIIAGESGSLLKFFGETPAISSVNSEFYQFINHEIYPDIRFIVDTIIDTQYGSSLTLYGDIDSYRPFYLPNPPGGIIKNGPGDLSLMGILSYSGSTVINDGSVFVSGIDTINSSIFTNNSLTVDFNTEPSGGQTFKLLPGDTVFPGSFNISINYPYLPTYDTSTSTLTVNNCSEITMNVSGVYNDTIFMSTNLRLVADTNLATNINNIAFKDSPCPFNEYPDPHRTLILDGSSSEYNTLFTVFNGFIILFRKLMIAKQGSGTWVFTDNVSNWRSRTISDQQSRGTPFLLFEEGTIILAGNATGGSATGSIIGKANDTEPVLGSADFNGPAALLLAQRARENNRDEIPIESREASFYARGLVIPAGITNSEVILGGSCYPNNTGEVGVFDANSFFRIGTDRPITLACDAGGVVRFLTPTSNWQKQDGSANPEIDNINIGTPNMTGIVQLETRFPLPINNLNIRYGTLRFEGGVSYTFGGISSGYPSYTIELISPPPLIIGNSDNSPAIIDLPLYYLTGSGTIQGFNTITFIGDNNSIVGHSSSRFRLFNNGSDPTIIVASGNHIISCPLLLDSTLTIQVAESCELDISGEIQPTSAGLIKDGQGSLVLQEPITYTGETSIIGGSLVFNSFQSPKIDSAIFSSNTLTVNFNREPTENSYKLLLGPTAQNYTTENIVLVGVTGIYTPAYNSLISTLSLDGNIPSPTLLDIVTEMSGVVAYYTALSGVIYDENNLVSQWNDQSNNNNHAVASLNARPTYSASGIYNQPVVEFSGTGQVLSAINSPSSSLPAVSVFIVYKRNGNGSGNDWMFMTANTTISVGLSVETGGVFRMTGLLNGSDLNGQHITDDLDPHLAGMIISGSSTYTYLDGVESSDIGSFPVSTSIGQLHIGGYPAGYGSPASPNGEFFNGQIAELILFNRALTTTERLLIEIAIQEQYGTFVS